MRCHYPTRLPIEFNPWLSTTDPRFGSSTPDVTVELGMGIHELISNNLPLFRWLRTMDLRMISARIFRSVPKEHYHLHVDLDPPENMNPDNQRFRLDDSSDYDYERVIKLNFIYNSHGSEMRWYRLKEGRQAQSWTNPSGVVSLAYDINDCDEIYATACDSHCLLHGGRIHTLQNTTNCDELRMCYSIMIQNATDTLTWSQAVKLLAPWLD
jgi:hypothetical protein